MPEVTAEPLVLAHTGGVVEVASVVVPLLLLGLILRAGKKAEHRSKDKAGDSDDDAEDGAEGRTP